MVEMVSVALVVLVVASVGAFELTDEQYYSMPHLFAMAPYEACVGAGGVYCLGTFRLKPATDHSRPLFDMMQKFSTGEFHFNHTVVHRGYCLSTQCRGVKASSDVHLFERCVTNHMRHQYGLQASLTTLDYCQRGSVPPEPFDTLDYAFAVVVLSLAVMNVVGTAYDLLRCGEKANKYLLAWSVRENFSRLFANYDSGDPRLTALKSVQGIRAFTLALVMLAHSMIVHHMAYIYNPEDIEKGSYHWLSTLFHNGSVVVQGFFLLSSFLAAYNLLLVADDNGTQLSIRMLPQCVLHRVIRILPLQLFTLLLSASWWRRGGGAQWPLLARHGSACRAHWWTHMAYLNNLAPGSEQCLIQTWFLAADLQLYILMATLTLLLARRQQVLKVLSWLFIGSVLLNVCIAYTFDLKPIMMIMNPETIRSQYASTPSFRWLYTAPWGSLPAALLGTLLAFLQRHLVATGKTPADSRLFRTAYQLFLPALVVWVLCGGAVRGAGRAAAALYAGADRAGYALIGAVGLLGFFNGVDSIWKRFFESRIWAPFGRASLGALLLHWNHHLTHLALRSQPSRVAVYEIGGHWHSVQFMTYFTAIPLYVCVELPAQRFLQALFFGNVPRLRQKTQ